MRFHQRNYVLYLILGKDAPAPIYEWAVWKGLVPALDPIVGAARGHPGMHSSQIDQITRRLVPFGKLGWNERSHMRWTHKSPLTAATSGAWFFEATQIYAPHWPTCVREDAAPDVYVHLHAEPAKDAGPFDLALLLALYAGLPRHILERTVPDAIAAAAGRMNALLVATQESPWGRTTGSGYTDIIQYHLVGLARSIEPADAQAAPNISSLPGQWRSLPVP